MMYRLGIAGISIAYPLETAYRGRNRVPKQAKTSPETMHESLPKESFPHAPTFDGASDQLEIDYAPALNPTSFTVEMWVLVQGGTGYQSVMSSVSGSPLKGRKGYLFCLTPSQQWQFWLGNGNPQSFWQVLSSPPMHLEDWTHLAGTYDQQGHTMAFYVN
ncbi:MAG: LamG domain-containing protein, partial [Symploca sp. SIO2B6]|nr:LamG domain-containing protein [Symploca sp. SIO2B6]